MASPLTISTKIRFQRVRDGRKRIAKAPAAVDRLPQLPLQSTKGLSIDTWPYR